MLTEPPPTESIDLPSPNDLVGAQFYVQQVVTVIKSKQEKKHLRNMLLGVTFCELIAFGAKFRVNAYLNYRGVQIAR